MIIIIFINIVLLGLLFFFIIFIISISIFYTNYNKFYQTNNLHILSKIRKLKVQILLLTCVSDPNKRCQYIFLFIFHKKLHFFNLIFYV